ncbi:MAG: hypothetical protein Q8L45_05895 [Xanthomonadaceae bacterium]|nr:hypothetical protein [Xanthomonadaceae bacterium]MDP2185139.1 hypothetical protein [Xanthomonadales bacterium]MDZ4115548.1 hypothetical protein [Xanthomonadaceae bacterium]MDZ4378007.1 hypothetical protein [Xanthomonadaceae bacterium]
MRIGFLFHHRPDQLWHAAPIAFEMSLLETALDVVIYCINDALVATAHQIGSGYPGHRCRIERIEQGRAIEMAGRLLRSWTSITKSAVLRLGTARFAALDALVVPDLTSLALRRRLPDLLMVFSNHGAGDRARGYDPRIARFDFVLVAGRKLERRFIEERLVRPGAYALVGYPKFDAVTAVSPIAPRPFANDLPTVLYNPHFEPTLSSWPLWGVKILEFFCANADRYNLIFAPHLKLFEHHRRYGARLPERFHRCPNILIDTDSAALTDMSYTRAADIYLGDVSSQVYEFLIEQRPCLFLDPRSIDWRNDPNYAHWLLGPVLTDLNALGPSLDRAKADHGHYRAQQKTAIADTFDLSDTPSARRAATAIRDFVAAHPQR